MRQILPVLPSNVSHSFRKSCHVIGQHSEGVSPDCKMCVRVTNTGKTVVILVHFWCINYRLLNSVCDTIMIQNKVAHHTTHQLLFVFLYAWFVQLYNS